MSTAICLLAVVPMRKEPSHRSEMVSQILFGEYAAVLEEKEEFVRVSCLYDGYEGWVQASQLTTAAEQAVLETPHYTNGFATAVTDNRTILQVPFGSPVYNASELSFTVGEKSFLYLCQPAQVWDSRKFKLTATELEAVYIPYLNTPYLWGGKSVFGIDCSGFAQQVFRFFGVKLLRDAYLQAGQGVTVGSFEEGRYGDLGFFQNEKGKITHVGILLGNNKIVHAAGRVRIDQITNQGIFNSETGRQSHVFHSIKRVF